MVYEGSCHCRNITFTLDWQSDSPTIPARACGCSFCVKHGGVWTSNPTAILRISIERPGNMRRYEFGTKTAQFHVCTACGIVPVVSSEIRQRLYAVVSVNCFDHLEPGRLALSPASFDGESEGDRLTRRQRHWIADVAFES